MSYYARKEFTERTARFLAVLIVIVWVWAITGCAVAPAREFCQVAHPILVHCAKGDDGKFTCRKCQDGFDCLTPETESEILSHDKTYDSLCK